MVHYIGAAASDGGDVDADDDKNSFLIGIHTMAPNLCIFFIDWRTKEEVLKIGTEKKKNSSIERERKQKPSGSQTDRHVYS